MILMLRIGHIPLLFSKILICASIQIMEGFDPKAENTGSVSALPFYLQSVRPVLGFATDCHAFALISPLQALPCPVFAVYSF
jgi:hypothetical protein